MAARFDAVAITTFDTATVRFNLATAFGSAQAWRAAIERRSLVGVFDLDASAQTPGASAILA